MKRPQDLRMSPVVPVGLSLPEVQVLPPTVAASSASVLLFFLRLESSNLFFSPQDPAGIFELVEVVGNGTYGQVYKVRTSFSLLS